MITTKIALRGISIALGIVTMASAEAHAQSTDPAPAPAAASVPTPPAPAAVTQAPAPPPAPPAVAAEPPPAKTSPLSGLEVRVRALYLAPANKSDAFNLPLPGGSTLPLGSDAISVSDKVIPELDVSYHFLKYLAAELVLTYPQKHTVYVDLPAAAGGKTSIGRFYHLPPSLLAQVHPLPDFVVDPYVGVGLNVTFMTSTAIADPGVTKLDLSSPSVGFAAQVGADIKLVGNFYANLDAKWVTIGADVETPAGAKVTHVTVNPFLLGGGLGYRF